MLTSQVVKETVGALYFEICKVDVTLPSTKLPLKAQISQHLWGRSFLWFFHEFIDFIGFLGGEKIFNFFKPAYVHILLCFFLILFHCAIRESKDIYNPFLLDYKKISNIQKVF